ncbi:hypothetical protein RN001_000896 [Aquatica leii]|uniref:Proteasome assembly chaperone 4 n=1 Tax=Aquatica leii TaxID=1421715 RepID=A0AAN7SSJ1_9COLE|nr:hypothetical protein RN001_000896 [Aquatica leii]
MSRFKNIENTAMFEPSNFNLYTFETYIIDKIIIYQIIKMSKSIFICVNYTNELNFNDLSYVILSRDNVPISTQLMGDFSEESFQNIAMRLCKKLKKNVYFSCNVNSDRITLPLIEEHLVKEINKYPEKF